MNAFVHRQSAHCESGVMSAMLSHHGLPLSEPMAFGLSASLAFAYLPFVRISGLPLISYRMPPRSIIRGLQKRIGVQMKVETYRRPEQGMAALDRHLAAGRVVGLQTSVYFLPYFPPEMRFHFNAHNLLVCGRDEHGYQISDPLFEQMSHCDRGSLVKARWARGVLAPRGTLYYPQKIPAEINYAEAIPAAIRANRRVMTGAPLPIIGLRGIRLLARNLLRLAAPAQDPRRFRLYLGHIVRMQEEIGTGGAGFRFVYASFLQESARLLNSDRLHEASARMTACGDQWRQFAAAAVRLSRVSDAPARQGAAQDLAERLRLCADREAEVWDLLGRK